MVKNIIGIGVAVFIGLTLFLSFYFGRLLSMKDNKAVDLVVSNQKKGKEISSQIYLIIFGLIAISFVLHFVFHI